MANWTLAPSLAQLRRELNARWPNRSKSHDGTIGDLAHAARKSEHNPDSQGIVRGMDITAKGIDTDELLDALIGDPRVHYVIHKGKIYSRAYGWKARKYTGSNPHTEHVHISIRNNTSESAGAAARAAAAADTSPWLAKGAAGDAAKPDNSTGGFKPVTPNPTPQPTQPQQEDDVPKVIEKTIDIRHGGGGWQVTDPFHIAKGPIKAMDLHAVIHGPEGARLVTRWVSWVPETKTRKGFWDRRPETVHTSHRAETDHQGFTVDDGVQLCLDVYTTAKPAEAGTTHRIVVSGLIWE